MHAQQGATTPTHVCGKFTNTSWRDRSDPQNERRGMKTKRLRWLFVRLELRGRPAGTRGVRSLGLMKKQY